MEKERQGWIFVGIIFHRPNHGMKIVMEKERTWLEIQGGVCGTHAFDFLTEFCSLHSREYVALMLSIF